MTPRRLPQADLSRRPYGPAAKVVWAVAGLGLVAIGLMVWLNYEASTFGDTPVSVLAALQLVLALLAFVLSGAVIVSRQPGNVIGWLLLIPGLALPLSELGQYWLENLDPVPVKADLWLWLVLGFVSWSWVLLIFPIFHLLLTFPNGKLLSPRWRWAVGWEAVMVATMLVVATFGEDLILQTEETIHWTVPNPIGFIPLAVVDEGLFGPVWSFGGLVITVVSASAVVFRFRSGSAEERQQLKWPLCAIALFGLVYGFSALTSEIAPGGVADFLFGLSLVAIPVSIAIAVLRYRLYEIDRIVSRTVAYTVVVALLVGLYAVLVGLVGQAFPADNNIAVAAATLVSAAAFSPLRRRVQRWVDRYFNRTRFDAQRELDAFASRLRQVDDLQTVKEDMQAVVGRTLQPTALSLWVRGET